MYFITWFFRMTVGLLFAGFRRDALKPVVDRVKREGMTYLDKAALMDIADAVRRTEQQSVPGVMIEAGCALGGSSVVIASAKKSERPFYVYDVFGMIPAPSEQDGHDVLKRYDLIRSGRSKGIGRSVYYGYQENLLETFRANLKKFNVPENEHHIYPVKGLYEDTMLIDQPVAFAHIDCDWYESVAICLKRTAPKMTSGGVIIIDDYFRWSGCRRAVDEFLSEESVKNQFRIRIRSRMQLIRR